MASSGVEGEENDTKRVNLAALASSIKAAAAMDKAQAAGAPVAEQTSYYDAATLAAALRVIAVAKPTTANTGTHAPAPDSANDKTTVYDAETFAEAVKVIATATPTAPGQRPRSITQPPREIVHQALKMANIAPQQLRDTLAPFSQSQKGAAVRSSVPAPLDSGQRTQVIRAAGILTASGHMASVEVPPEMPEAVDSLLVMLDDVDLEEDPLALDRAPLPASLDTSSGRLMPVVVGATAPPQEPAARGEGPFVPSTIPVITGVTLPEAPPPVPHRVPEADLANLVEVTLRGDIALPQTPPPRSPANLGISIMQVPKGVVGSSRSSGGGWWKWIVLGLVLGLGVALVLKFILGRQV